jgi:GNAT superfamily N-acetyltransferase
MSDQQVDQNAGDLTLAAIAPSDEGVWRELWRGYLDYYETELPDEIYRSSFARLCDPAVTNYNGFIARVNGKAVGLVHFIYHLHGWCAEDVCYLQDLYTTPDARGAGVGKTLIEAVYAAADANGTPRVYWLTQDFNHTARRLYDQVARLSPFIKYDRP